MDEKITFQALWTKPSRRQYCPRFPVPAIQTNTPGLVIHHDLMVDKNLTLAEQVKHPAFDKTWTLAHLDSGWALCTGIKNKKMALKLAHALTEIDWKVDKDTLLKVPDLQNTFFTIKRQILEQPNV